MGAKVELLRWLLSSVDLSFSDSGLYSLQKENKGLSVEA